MEVQKVSKLNESIVDLDGMRVSDLWLNFYFWLNAWNVDCAQWYPSNR